jgi:hypothetical protein
MTAEATTEAGAAPTLTPQSHLGFRPLSILQEGEEFLVGDPATGTFISIPEVGAVAVRELEAGRTIAEAGAAASAHAGQEVDVLDFAEGLVASGLVTAVDGVPLAGDTAAPKPRWWLEGVRPELVRPLFSAPAWVLYGLAFAFCVSVLATRRDLFPTFEDWFFYPNPALCIAVMTVVATVLAAVHEGFHWLAARAAGVAARFKVTRRQYLLVFETDLSQLWSVPKARRFSPFLAGMAFDSLVLATALGVRLGWSDGWLDVPPLLVRFLGAIVLLELLALGFQLMIFLRTDLYAVLITILGCRNLWRVNLLTLKRRVWPLSSAERSELDQAHARDRAVARWFALLYLGGLAWMGWVFVSLVYPTTVLMIGWMFHTLCGAPVGSSGFWQAVVLGALAAFRLLAPLAVFVRERLAA